MTHEEAIDFLVTWCSLAIILSAIMIAYSLLALS